MSALVILGQFAALVSMAAVFVLAPHLYLGSWIREQIDGERRKRRRNWAGAEWFRKPVLEIATAVAFATLFMPPQLAIVLAVPELAASPEVVGKAFVGGWLVLTLLGYEWYLARKGLDGFEVSES